LAVGKGKLVEEDLKAIGRILGESSGKGDRRQAFELQRLRILMQIEGADYSPARKALDNGADLPARVRSSLRKELADTIIQNDVQSTDLRKWANEVKEHG
jgi:hypothetical protein